MKALKLSLAFVIVFGCSKPPVDVVQESIESLNRCLSNKVSFDDCKGLAEKIEIAKLEAKKAGVDPQRINAAIKLANTISPANYGQSPFGQFEKAFMLEYNRVHGITDESIRRNMEKSPNTKGDLYEQMMAKRELQDTVQFFIETKERFLGDPSEEVKSHPEIMALVCKEDAAKAKPCIDFLRTHRK